MGNFLNDFAKLNNAFPGTTCQPNIIFPNNMLDFSVPKLILNTDGNNYCVKYQYSSENDLITGWGILNNEGMVIEPVNKPVYIEDVILFINQI